VYEEIYCSRGDMENRIKECQLDLHFGDDAALCSTICERGCADGSRQLLLR
jgi:hypothetical protein